MLPEYQKKIIVMNALAPVAFMKNIKLFVRDSGSELIKPIKQVVAEFMPHNNMMLNMCTQSKFTETTCLESFYRFLGKDPQMINMVII